MPEPINVVNHPGLEGVVVAETAVGDVRGAEGFFHYRGHSAVELAASTTLLDVWHLLLDGSLPQAEERERFAREVAAARVIPPALLPALRVIAETGGGPLAQLRTALSVTGQVLRLRPTRDLTAEQLRADALRMTALAPALVAGLYRLSQGLEPVEDRPELHGAAWYLWQLFGREVDPLHAAALERYLVLTCDHGFNNSTFTARVATSTGADMAAVLVAALASLSGPLHGGAPSRALEMLDAIGDPSRTHDHVRAIVERDDRVMGFGHRIYRVEDPRSALLRQTALEMHAPLADFAVQVEREVLAALAELKPGRELHTNVEFYAGVVMDACGIPRELFTPTFTVSRIIGWAAHAIEQASGNRLIRPAARYVGELRQPAGALSS